MHSESYESWFTRIMGVAPRAWQARLAGDATCTSRLVRVPTGLGKTLGVLGAWAYHRLEREDESWPRRLVLVLPMRVLVEQCESEVRRVLAFMGRLAEGTQDLSDPCKVGVHLMMGGVDQVPWYLYPERDAVLLGTQDMLLSRALNRGYASPRARWPMEYGLLHQDTLWVLDEVQLMGVGLATSAQLQAFRDALEAKSLRPTRSWWMSATLQSAWFEHSAYRERLAELDRTTICVPEAERVGGPFEATKAVRIVEVPREHDPKLTRWGATVVEAHRNAPAGSHGRITLAVCNTVEDAVTLHDAVTKGLGKGSTTEVRLVHSRFRGMERAAWRREFLNRDACQPDTDRIVVATQVVEAGVDVTASALVTQLAPWPSLVQRFGRAARYGGAADITVVDRVADQKSALPYEPAALQAAKEALSLLRSASLADIEELEANLRSSDADLLRRLYPFEPVHVLTRREHDDLFDTEPDLTGSDLDISRFIREGDERDVLVWWWPVRRDDPHASPAKSLQPSRDELCRVPVAKARIWLDKVMDDRAAWVWDYLEGCYLPVRPGRIFPGQTILVDSDWGGYDTAVGFTGTKRAGKTPPVPHLEGVIPDALTSADLTQDDDSLSAYSYRSIATHGSETAERSQALCRSLDLSELESILRIAGLVHDFGKAHAVFQAAIVAPERPSRNDLAKAPRAAWKRPPYENREDPSLHRPGFRHELASTLMLFELLRRADPEHAALLGPHGALREAGLIETAPDVEAIPKRGLVLDLLGLSARHFDLVAYLVMSHHGKVRAGLRATPQDQEGAARGSPPLRGVAEGDRVPSIAVQADGGLQVLPELSLSLALAELGVSSRYGSSWTARVAGLLDEYGPHTLAFLEALLRVADVRASSECTGPDAVLEQEGA